MESHNLCILNKSVILMELKDHFFQFLIINVTKLDMIPLNIRYKKSVHALLT
jgi:hypothetical protein